MDQLATGNNNRDLLTTAIGPTVGYHISQCAHGGYIVTVDGRIHAACSTLVEAMQAMGRVAAAQYNETSEPPERARDVTREDEDPLPSGVLPIRPPETARHREPPSPEGMPIRQTVATVLVMITALAAGVLGV
ncbi:MAG TPA: hypothetical protein VG758_21135 [Hyphomicrobiaceae bacterium]|jgi:hypothetical protein|nr:hypothetical protein [Hyphomicrobiaceae bacterium]